MTDEEITFEELQEIVNSPLKNKRTIKDFAKIIFNLSNKNKQLKKENEQLKKYLSIYYCLHNEPENFSEYFVTKLEEETFPLIKDCKGVK